MPSFVNIHWINVDLPVSKCPTPLCLFIHIRNEIELKSNQICMYCYFLPEINILCLMPYTHFTLSYCARLSWKLSVKVVFIFSSKTRVLVWYGLKQAENWPKTSCVSDLRLSLGENVRFQKWAFSACFQAENDPFINSGTEVQYCCSIGWQ